MYIHCWSYEHSMLWALIYTYIFTYTIFQLHYLSITFTSSHIDKESITISIALVIHSTLTILKLITLTVDINSCTVCVLNFHWIVQIRVHIVVENKFKIFEQYFLTIFIFDHIKLFIIRWSYYIQKIIFPRIPSSISI